ILTHFSTLTQQFNITIEKNLCTFHLYLLLLITLYLSLLITNILIIFKNGSRIEEKKDSGRLAEHDLSHRRLHAKKSGEYAHQKGRSPRKSVRGLRLAGGCHP